MSQISQRAGVALLISFFIAAALYPTARVLLMGSRTAVGFGEILFSLFPDLLLIACFGVSVFYRVGKEENSTNLSTRATAWWTQFNAVDKAVLLFLSFNVVYGLAIGGDVMLAGYSIRLTYLPVLMYFVARLLELEHKQAVIRSFLHALFVSLAVVGLVLYVAFPDAVRWMMDAGNYFQSVYFVPRLTSVFWNPIVFSTVAGIGVLMFFGWFLRSRSRIALTAFYILLTAMLLTVSRGAIWSCVVASLVVSVVSLQWKRAAFVYLQIAMIIGMAWVVPALREVLIWFIESSQQTALGEGSVSRVVLWQRSWNDFIEKPFGFGLGKAGHVAHRFLLDSNTRAAVWSTDGWYLKMANETGVPGLLTIVALFCTTGWLLLKNLKSLMGARSVWLIGVLTFVAVQCVVSNVLDFFFVAPLFWFLFGLLINNLSDEREPAGS